MTEKPPKGKKQKSPESPAGRRLLRTSEAAKYLGVSDWKIRDLIYGNKLPFVQDEPTAPFRVDVKDLDAYIDRQKRMISQ